MKRSVFLKISLTFVLLYSLYVVVWFTLQLEKDYERLSTRKRAQTSNYLSIGKILLRHGQFDDLLLRLDDGMKAASFDFYRVSKNGEELAFASAAGSDDPIQFPQSNEEGEYDNVEYGIRHFLVKEGDYTLVLGHKTSFWVLAKYYFLLEKEYLLKDFLFVCSMVAALVIYSFRDLISLLSTLRRRGSKKMRVNQAQSKETLTLVQAIKGYQSESESLAQENSLLKGQVLPALQKELKSGQTPPYEFDCTLVRTDINGFTTIFASRDRSEFMRIINEFFIGVAHIASRYNGYVYEFIGDEVIFYFKDAEHSNSSAIALSAVRDVNALADQFNERTQAENGYPFRVKSSLSWGKLRFGPLVNGFSLAGNPLIESVRMLSHVHEKSSNTVLFDQALLDRVGFLCTTRDLGVAMLKGFSNSRRLHVYEGHVPLIHHLRQERSEFYNFAFFYRSDDDICEMLDFIRTHHKTLALPDLQTLFSALRACRLTQLSVNIRQAYLKLVDELKERCRVEPNDRAMCFTALCSTISLASRLFPLEEFKGRLRDTLLSCVELDHKRVIANVVDIFTELDPEASEEIFDKLLGHDDHRISANALIKSAKVNWNFRMHRRLKAMLRTQEPYRRASGLYALGEIAHYFRKTDEVAFHADLKLQALVEEGLMLVSSTNEMTQRQAFKAMIKAGRQEELLALAPRLAFIGPELRQALNELRGETQAPQDQTKPQLRLVG